MPSNRTRRALCASMILLAAAARPAAAQTAAADGPFARYAPSLCVEAARRMQDFYWRDKRADTLVYAPLTDSLPGIVRDSLRRCVARFTPATVASDELVPLVTASLLAGDSVRAAAATARLAAAFPAMPPALRRWTMADLGMAQLAAAPVRLAEARAVAARLDTMGAAAAYERLSLHWHIAAFAVTAGALDVAEAESRASLAAVKELTPEQQITLCDTITASYLVRVRTLALRDGAAPALALLDTMATVITPFTRNGMAWADQAKAQLDNAIGLQRFILGFMGQRAKPIHGDYWYPFTPGDTVFPRPGRVTVAMLLDGGTMDFKLFATLRRLHASYAARGLDIVFMTVSRGFYRMSVLPDPAVEAGKLRGFFVDYLKLPLALTVEESQFGRLSDGRRQNTASLNATNYRVGVGMALIGKDGSFKMLLTLSPESELLYRRAIEAELLK